MPLFNTEGAKDIVHLRHHLLTWALNVSWLKTSLSPSDYVSHLLLPPPVEFPL